MNKSIMLTLSLCATITMSGTAVMAQDAAPSTAPGSAAAPAAAATPAPAAAPMADIDAGAAYTSARNQLGVLTYCQDKGFIGGEAAEVQRKMIAMLPQGDAAKGDAAEALGKTGTVSAMGTELTLAEGAAKQGSTEDALCKQMDTMMQQLGKQLPQ